jgi:5-methylthioribose kinase
LYQKQKRLSDTELTQLVSFLNELHAIPLQQVQNFSTNLELRSLNHQHIFVYPFLENNGMDLNKVQPDLQEVAMPYKTNTTFRNKATELGKLYVAPGKNLLHGDYYPGSWLRTKGQLKIIDPEFSFVGRNEFEVGIFIGHLKMSEATDEQITFVHNHYHSGNQFNWNLCYQFAGIEMMRRIIGLAQLPFDLTVQKKEQLLKEAYTYIMDKHK